MNQSTTSESKPITLAAFEQSLRKQQISRRSIESYKSDLKAFLQHQSISADSIDSTKINQIHQPQIESYFQYLILKKVKFSTLRRTLASIRRFFIFLADEGLIKSNPAETILLRSIRKDAFTSDEILLLFRYLIKRQSSLNESEVLRFLRDQLILSLMIFHGIRQYQIPTLKLSAIQQSNGSIVLEVSKDFRIKLEGLVLNSLQNYLLIRNSNARTIFLEPVNPAPTSVSDLRAMLLDLRYSLNLECTPKKLFNTYLHFQDHSDEKKRILDLLNYEFSRNNSGAIQHA